jgi:hypothetical protein
LTITGSKSSVSVETHLGGLAELRDRAAAPRRLYAILDSCDEPRIPERVQQMHGKAASLYRGAAERDFWAIAPYLVEVDAACLEWIVSQLAETPWGVFVESTEPLAMLRKHFRRFLMVQNSQGESMYFRFYDPRVLPWFLRTCLPHEAHEFFGPVAAFFVQRTNTEYLMLRLAEAAAKVRTDGTQGR